jgi:hypothetical protein
VRRILGVEDGIGICRHLGLGVPSVCETSCSSSRGFVDSWIPGFVWYSIRSVLQLVLVR